MAAKIKLLLLDVDGVLTDGTKLYGPDGSVIGKSFNDKDFTAIKRFVEAGIPVEWISGCSFNKAIAEKRNITFRLGKLNGVLSKAHLLPAISGWYGVDVSEIAYIGDDYFDLDIMQEVGFAGCPNDAIYDVKIASHWVARTKGGGGVIAELFDHVCTSHGIKTNDERLREIDAKEK